MHKVPDQMYAAHKALNYKMTEKKKYKQKLFMEQANRQRELVSKNWYNIQKGNNGVSESGKDTNTESKAV